MTNEEGFDASDLSAFFLGGREAGSDPTRLLFESIQQGNVVDARRAIDCGADIDAVDKENSDKTPLHIAAAASSKECLLLLLEHSRRPLRVDANGQTALHAGAQYATSLVCSAVLIAAYGLDGTVDCRGNTFLHYLFGNRRVPEIELVEFTRWLTSYERSVSLINIINKRSETVADVALQAWGHSAFVLQILLSSGARKAKEICFSSQQYLLTMEDVERGKKMRLEEKNWSKIRSLFARSRAHFLRRLKRRLCLLEDEEDGRCRLLLKERKRRGRIAGHFVENMRFVKRVELERFWAKKDDRPEVVKWEEKEEKSVEEQQKLPLALLLPLFVTEEEPCVVTDNFEKKPAKTEQSISVILDDIKGGAVFDLKSDDIRCAAAAGIWSAYSAYKKRKMRKIFLREWLEESFSIMHKAAVCIQARIRGFIVRREFKKTLWRICGIQRKWRLFLLRRRLAIDIIRKELECQRVSRRVKQVVSQGVQLLLKEKILGVMYAVTQLLWRENFCATFCEIVFRRKRENFFRPVCKSSFVRFYECKLIFFKWLLLVQFVLGLFMLIFIGATSYLINPRLLQTTGVAVSVVLLLMQLLMPIRFWRLADSLVIIVSLVCAIAKYNTGVCALSLLTLKLPFVIRAFFPTHSSTRTYCQALEQTALYLLLLLPLPLACVGACFASLVLNSSLPSSPREWCDLFLIVLGTFSPQYKMERLHGINGQQPASNTLLLLDLRTKMEVTSYNVGEYVLLRERLPAFELGVLRVFFFFWTLSASFIGVHDAIRKHYGVSDETKLRNEEKRLRGACKRGFLNEAHRAKNMKALGKQLDGAVWEADVRAAKEAIDASHWDHKAGTNVHRFVRRVQDSVLPGEMDLGYLNGGGTSFFTLPVSAKCEKWDCRNEHPESRFVYDVAIIEAALGVRERVSFFQGLMQRQWVGPVTKRETTLFVIAVLVMASVKPNNYWIEMSFSLFFALELILSFCFLRCEYIIKCYIRLFIRFLCVIVGLVPSLIPFAILRAFRFCEGWSSIFPVSGMVQYWLLHLFVTLITMYMICFVAIWQFYVESGGKGICNSVYTCMYTSLREMFFPAWTYTHINIAAEPPVACFIILLFQLVFIPIIVTIVLHPLLHISSFIGRFIRLVVQKLHQDVIDYVNSYLEGPLWFSHWRLGCDIHPRIITKLRMWVYDIRRRRGFNEDKSIFLQWGLCDGPRRNYSMGVGCNQANDESMRFEKSIISQPHFASFEENEVYHNPFFARHKTLLLLCRALRKPVLHYIHAVITILSIAFLWVVDSSSTLQDPMAVVGIVIHSVSMLTALLLIQRDALAYLTLLIIIVLAMSLGMQYISYLKLRHFFCLRFFSLLRLGHLRAFFGFRMRRFTHMTHLLFTSGISMLFPLIVAGSFVYTLELLRSQIYLVYNYNPSGSSNETFFKSLPKRLSVKIRGDSSYPNGEDVQKLFAYFFFQDAGIIVSFFALWLLPAVVVATALTYLWRTSAIFFDFQCLLIDAIRLLEDPMTIAGFKTYCVYLRWLGHGFLLASLVLGLSFTPRTNFSLDNHRFFFLCESILAVFCFLDGVLRFSYAIHRSICSWAVWSCMARGSVEKKVVVGNTLLLFAELLQLLYWACILPLALALLMEGNHCLISPKQYSMYVITFRFVLLLRLLPRVYSLLVALKIEVVVFVIVCIIVYFVGAASALADAYAAISGDVLSAKLLRIALFDIWMETLTLAAPTEVRSMWTPPNSTQIVEEMIASNLSLRVTYSTYVTSPSIFTLAIVGKLLLALLFGVLFAFFLVPMPFIGFSSIPPKASFLYRTLCGGTDFIVDIGARLHDDMRPEDRKKIQRRKFARMFQACGIPMWLLPHLLEEIGMAKPGQQRRFMFILEQLFVFLPISEKRARCVEEYTTEWELYNSGGPGKLSFTELPVYPAQGKARDARKATDNTAVYSRYVSPLRLVQAIALLELGFPPHSSAGSRIWLEFFKVAQRIRGATLMQSLWRMYTTVRKFESDIKRSKEDVLMAQMLRRAFRRNVIFLRVTFLHRGSFTEAMRFQSNIFNPGTGHYDVLNRLRGHFSELQPTFHFCLRRSLILNHVSSAGASFCDNSNNYHSGSGGREATTLFGVSREHVNPLLGEVPRDMQNAGGYMFLADGEENGD